MVYFEVWNCNSGLHSKYIRTLQINSEKDLFRGPPESEKQFVDISKV